MEEATAGLPDLKSQLFFNVYTPPLALALGEFPNPVWLAQIAMTMSTPPDRWGYAVGGYDLLGGSGRHSDAGWEQPGHCGGGDRVGLDCHDRPHR